MGIFQFMAELDKDFVAQKDIVGLSNLSLGLKRREEVDLHLKDLHWLKVQERIEFKILLLTFKSLHGLAPSYLSELVKYNSSGCRDVSLYCPIDKSPKAFSMAAPRIWNDLPQVIKQCRNINDFKSKLKSHLFRKSYNVY